MFGVELRNKCPSCDKAISVAIHPYKMWKGMPIYVQRKLGACPYCGAPIDISWKYRSLFSLGLLALAGAIWVHKPGGVEGLIDIFYVKLFLLLVAALSLVTAFLWVNIYVRRET